jgi:hypothetical protein
MRLLATLCLLALPLPTLLGSSQEPTPPEEAPPGEAQLEPTQWRVIWTTDPQHTATISWSTLDAGDEHEVQVLGQEPGDTARVFPSHRDGQFTTSSDLIQAKFYHHAKVTGLEPGKLYEFVIDSGAEPSAPMTFRSAPAVDSSEPFSLIYGGDSRTGKEDRKRMNRLSKELVASHPEAIAFLHGGDYVYDGSDLGMWDDWLTHDELRTMEGGRVLPIVPTRGNHDFGAIFEEVFDTPGGKDKNYYHTALPFGVNLLTLNTNISHAGEQRDWMKLQLEELRAKSRWLLAQYHRPAYPAVKEAGTAKTAWVPHFEYHNVDLVFESDGHVIKRTLPIRDEGHDPTGVVYLGEGGLGVPQRTPHRNRWYLQEPGMTARGHHLTLATFEGDELRLITQGFAVDEETGRIADPEGATVVFDNYVMQRRK